MKKEKKCSSCDLTISNIYLILGSFVIIGFIGYLLYNISYKMKLLENNYYKEDFINYSYLDIAPYLGESIYTYNPENDNLYSHNITYKIQFPPDYDKNNKLYLLSSYDNIQICNNQVNNIQKYVLARHNKYIRYIRNNGVYTFIYVDNRIDENNKLSNKNNKLSNKNMKTTLYIDNGNNVIKESDITIIMNS
jgi:hypothetical protein